MSSFCEMCSATDRLSVDHVIPVSERPDLAYEILNTRVLCLSCNGRRGNNCTDAEREAVLNAITAKKERTQRVSTHPNARKPLSVAARRPVGSPSDPDFRSGGSRDPRYTLRTAVETC
jgi:hypothetical protein